MSNIENQSLFEKLNALSHTDYYPFHMPGHKRTGENYPLGDLYRIDITEIDEFDNLHEPEEMIKECMTSISRMYKADKSYLLVNGSTCGILSAVSACVPRGGKILLARNSHKSAYHAVFLNDLEVRYLYPKYIEAYDVLGGILPEQVEKELNQQVDIKAVFITSPTYDGMISNVGRIVEICHKYGVICIVDEAHGAHLGLFGSGAKSAVELGADVVIHSVHKTLPAPTQTALLHVNGGFVDRELVEYYLQIYQTSSPSYILLAGIEECFRILRQHGETLFQEFIKNKEAFYIETGALKKIRVFSDNNFCKGEYGVVNMDMMKVVISVKHQSMSGKQLFEVLRDTYHLQMEMYSESYVLAIITIMDKKEGFCRLAMALNELEKKIYLKPVLKQREKGIYFRKGSQAIQTIYDAQMQKKESVSLDSANGRVSGSFINLYPPGIPIIVPGEEFTEEVIEVIDYFCSMDYKIQGMDKASKKLVVVKDERYVKM